MHVIVPGGESKVGKGLDGRVEEGEHCHCLPEGLAVEPVGLAVMSEGLAVMPGGVL